MPRLCRATAILLGAVSLAAVTMATPAAEAAFPGRDGKIVFSGVYEGVTGPDLWVTRPDGTGRPQQVDGSRRRSAELTL